MFEGLRIIIFGKYVSTLKDYYVKDNSLKKN